MTSGRKTDEATSETSKMDNTETDMPPLLEVSDDDSDSEKRASLRSQPQKPVADHKRSNFCTPFGSL